VNNSNADGPFRHHDEKLRSFESERKTEGQRSFSSVKIAALYSPSRQPAFRPPPSSRQLARIVEKTVTAGDSTFEFQIHIKLNKRNSKTRGRIKKKNPDTTASLKDGTVR
jgi:hypothetical protein